MTSAAKILRPYAPVDSRIAFNWLLKLRWGAVACQLLLIAAVSMFFDISIPAPILLVVIFFQCCSNLYFHFLEKKRTVISQNLFGMIMAWDVVHLTLLIYFTGGPMNPFTFLFLVHVALGAILMNQGWAWSLNFMTIAAYALLFFIPPFPDPEAGLVPTPTVPICLTGSEMGMHLQGMWLAYAVTASFIVFFANRIHKDMETHQQTLASLEEEKLRSEKMASLATLAAGAAHEFSTPLSTIAVAAGEMAHNLDEQKADQELLDDVILIRSEVKKCAADAGQHLGETVVPVSLSELADTVTREFATETGREISLGLEAEDLTIKIPLQTWLRTIKGLFKNAHDASPNNDIEGRIFIDNEYLAFAINDAGAGMPEETFARATDPFFTTKEPGKGMGLGLFLARSLAERFGGDLLIESEPGKGSTVILRVELERIQT
jgi:two-component system sensor histidine kinase RegB